MSSYKSGLTIRRPQPADVPQMWALARKYLGNSADSSYTFMILCTYFSETGCVGIDPSNTDLVGFMLCFLLPSRPDTIFGWLSCVKPDFQGQHVMRRLLLEIVLRPVCRNVKFYEGTLTKSNIKCYDALMGFAKQLGVTVEMRSDVPHFPGRLMPHADSKGENSEEDEYMMRMGPFDWETLVTKITSKSKM